MSFGGGLAIDGYERKKEPNPFNYTDDEKQDKLLALKTMKELWPNVPEFYADLVYDLCKNTSPEEMEKIKWKVDNEPTRHVIPEVLISNKMEIIDKEDSLEFKKDNLELNE
jgi:hypothetical protein